MPTDGKLVVLKFDGDLQQGFRIVLEIGHECERPSVELVGALPPNPEIALQLSQWQRHYHSLSANSLIKCRIQPQQLIYGGSVNRLDGCWQSATELLQQMKQWLESSSFRRLDLRLRESLSPNESIRVLIRTQDPLLRRLPWHLWDFVERYTKTEIALSAPVSERVEVKPAAGFDRGVRILAVLGNSKNINVQADREFLTALPDVKVTFLVEPSRREICSQLWDQPWDILFFAGHSLTDGDRGLVYINPDESLSLEELKYGLKQAISKGLRLAIFNSCDGLGLAQSLESFHLPQMIIMREPVPDRVAQEFLKYLLTAFSSGKSLYLSVREAREQLQSMEDQFPCATWLPIICQNPAEIPPTWQTLVHGEIVEQFRQDSNINPSPLVSQLPLVANAEIATQTLRPAAQHWAQYWRRWADQIHKGWIVILISLIVTMGLTSSLALDWTQPWDLRAYDRMMQQRPNEGDDPRLLIIEVTDDDIEEQRKNVELLERRSRSAQSYNQIFETSLSDHSLDRLLSALDQYQPRVIGLDIYRDFAAVADHSTLSSRLHHDSKLVAVCKAEDFNDPTIPSIDPPPEIPLSRVGFSDFREDSDGILRRHLLGMQPLVRTQTSRCNTDRAFSLQVAAQYLAQQHVETQFTVAGDFRLNEQTIEVLRSRGSSYPPDAGGSEILLNYRATPEVAARVTLQQFLNQQINPNYLRDKVVLIGVTAPDGEDLWSTPIHPDAAMPGVIVQAHMISQLLSAALDHRPLLTTLSWWQQIGYVWTWATVGGFLSFWQWRRKEMGRSAVRLGVSLVGATVFLYGLCFLGLLRGHWLPFVSLALALIVSSTLVIVYLYYPSRSRVIWKRNIFTV